MGVSRASLTLPLGDSERRVWGLHMEKTDLWGHWLPVLCTGPVNPNTARMAEWGRRPQASEVADSVEISNVS